MNIFMIVLIKIINRFFILLWNIQWYNFCKEIVFFVSLFNLNWYRDHFLFLNFKSILLAITSTSINCKGGSNILVFRPKNFFPPFYDVCQMQNAKALFNHYMLYKESYLIIQLIQADTSSGNLKATIHYNRFDLLQVTTPAPTISQTSTRAQVTQSRGKQKKT